MAVENGFVIVGKDEILFFSFFSNTNNNLQMF